MSEEEVPQQEVAGQHTVEGYIASKVNDMQQDIRAEWIPPEIVPKIVEGATYYANLRLDIDLEKWKNWASEMGPSRLKKIDNFLSRTVLRLPIPKLYPDEVYGHIEAIEAQKAELHESGTLTDKEEMAHLAVWGYIAKKQIEVQQKGTDKKVA